MLMRDPRLVVRNDGISLRGRSNEDTGKLEAILGANQVQLRPLFGKAGDGAGTDCPQDVSPHPDQFFEVLGGDEAGLRIVAEQLLAGVQGLVRVAYLAPRSELPTGDAGADAAPGQVEGTDRQDYRKYQGYLDSPPDGIGARSASAGRRAAWDVPGGKGAGVRVVDIEGAWNFDHDDLAETLGGLKFGTQTGNGLWRQHGTAVAGVIGGDNNAFGVTGIAPDAVFFAMSVYRDDDDQQHVSQTIESARRFLKPGEVLLLEQEFKTQHGDLVPLEWYPDALAAITCATRKGIVVVEAAGNGGLNLDELPPFDSLKNPLTADAPSGAVMVGAGVSAYSANSERPARSRMRESNYGSRLDAQGWGDQVVSTGYGDIHQAPENQAYTIECFHSTSSASAIVAGAIISMQGQRLAADLQPLTPSEMRAWLVKRGSQQQGSAEKIGNLPDLTVEQAQ